MLAALTIALRSFLTSVFPDRELMGKCNFRIIIRGKISGELQPVAILVLL